MKDMVSVIIPTYNRSEKIVDSLNSVLIQTYENIEVIIVDDGSTDDTEQVISKVNDYRVRYIKQKNCGPAAARNRGVLESRGEYIAFQDSDDIWLPNKLELQMNKMRSDEQQGMIYCAFYYNKEGRQVKYPSDTYVINQLEENILESLWKKNLITPQAMLIRRKCFDEVGGFNEELQSLEDWEFALRFSNKFKIGYLNKCLLRLNYSDDGVNERWKEAAKTLLYMLKEFSDLEYNNKYILGTLFERLAIISKVEPMNEWKKQMIPNLVKNEKEFELLLQAYKKCREQKIINRIYRYINDFTKIASFIKKNDLLSQNILAIYGAGEVGVYLAKELRKRFDKKIVLIDKNSIILDDFEVVKPEEINSTITKVIITVLEGIDCKNLGIKLSPNIKCINIFEFERW